MNIKDMQDSSRPREKFLKYGPKNLSEAELFAIILRTGTRGKIGEKGDNIIEVSNKLIKEYPLERLFDCSLNELQSIKGIGQTKAMQILAISELGKRYNSSKNPIKKISSAKDVFEYFKEKLRDEKQENFYVLMLNNQNIIIKEELISKGVLDAAIIDPREVFKPAIKSSSAKIIIIHNHPSGNPEPSKEDIELTNILIESGNLLRIKVLDHVIIGENEYWSWIENH
jgi:DNA repair protein RadC